MPVNTSSPMVIAVDGPAASGKGTLAKKLAKYLGYNYLDTGRLYRATAAKLMRQGADIHDSIAAANAAATITLEDLDFGNDLANEEVGKVASIVSAQPKVRDALLAFQHKFAQSPEGAVLDGRDIGTIVCPNADFKLFITANLETRAKRRYKELIDRGNKVIYEEVLNDLNVRDERDSQRSIAPLVQAEDAIYVETSDMDADQVFRKVLALLEAHIEKNQ